MTIDMCFAIILPMKDIDVRWVENSKTKKTSLKTISREKYNDYPEGTATVQLENIKSKNSDAKVWFIFEGKNDVVTEWDYQKQAGEQPYKLI